MLLLVVLLLMRLLLGYTVIPGYLVFSFIPFPFIFFCNYILSSIVVDSALEVSVLLGLCPSIVQLQ